MFVANLSAVLDVTMVITKQKTQYHNKNHHPVSTLADFNIHDKCHSSQTIRFMRTWDTYNYKLLIPIKDIYIQTEIDLYNELYVNYFKIIYQH